MPDKKEIIEVSFRATKDTNTKRRFDEIVEPGSQEVTGAKIYLFLHLCKRMGNPQVVHVRLEGE